MKSINILFGQLSVACYLMMGNGCYANDVGTDKFKVVGSMGLMKFIIIPEDKQGDIEFHRQIIKKICVGGETCFLNFFTNSKQVPETFPLDDRILSEPTLMYKYSPKHRNEIEDWSCRLKLPITSCF